MRPNKNDTDLTGYLNNKLNEMMSKSPSDSKAKQKILSKVLNLEQENLQTQGGKNSTKAQEKQRDPSPIIDIQKLLVDESTRYNSPSSKLKSNQFFAERRIDKIKSKNPKLIESEKHDRENEKKEDLLNSSQKASQLTVEIEDDVANIEELKGIEKEPISTSNKVMADWIEKNQKSLEKSCRLEPILKKKNDKNNEENLLISKKFEEKLEENLLISKKIEEDLYISKKIEEKISQFMETKPKPKEIDLPGDQTEKLTDEIKKKSSLFKTPQSIKKNGFNSKNTSEIKNKSNKQSDAKTRGRNNESGKNTLQRSTTPKNELDKVGGNILMRSKTPENKNSLKKKNIFFDEKSEEKKVKQVYINDEENQEVSEGKPKQVNINEEENQVVSQNFIAENFKEEEVITTKPLNEYSEDKMEEITISLQTSINILTMKSLQVLRKFLHENESALCVCRSLLCLISGVNEEIPKEFLTLDLDPNEIDKFLSSPSILVNTITNFINLVEEEKIKENNILFALEILNSSPSLTSTTDFLVSEHIRKISRLIEAACEFYKIYKQKKIFSEIDQKQSDEALSEELGDENEIQTRKKKSTIDIINLASNNLAKLVNEYEISESQKRTPKSFSSKSPKVPIKNEYRDLVGDKLYNELDKKYKNEQTKKLNKELSKKNEKNLKEEKGQKHLETKSKFLEEKEAKKAMEEEQRKMLRQEIERQYELERRFKEYLTIKKKNEDLASKKSKFDDYVMLKEQKALEALQNKIRIQEEYMKTLEEGAWKEHQKKLDEMKFKITNEEKLEMFLEQREQRKKNSN